MASPPRQHSTKLRIGWAGDLVLADRAVAQQLLDVAVVARAGNHRTATHVIDAAVADVRPVGLLPLHQADRAGRARAHVHREPGADCDHCRVRAADREVQEAERIEQWLGLGAKQFEHDLAADFGCARAVRMSAHAVHDDEQRRALARGDCGAVLVVFAVAGQADLGALDCHALTGGSMTAAPC